MAKVAVRRLGVPACTQEQFKEYKKAQKEGKPYSFGNKGGGRPADNKEDGAEKGKGLLGAVGGAIGSLLGGNKSEETEGGNE